MRDHRDDLQGKFNHFSALAEERQTNIDQINADYAQKELDRLEGKVELGTQTIIGANYFNKKPGMQEMNSSRGSGSLQSSQRTREMPGGKRVGGGGRIANRPPAGGPRKDSRTEQ
jgi:hypothetical protein